MIRYFQQKKILKLSSDNAVSGKMLTEIGLKLTNDLNQKCETNASPCPMESIA